MLKQINAFLDRINKALIFILLIILVYLPLMVINLVFNLIDMEIIWNVGVAAYASVLTVLYFRR